MTDWNWFFSSLAQPVALIVGIFGVFIIKCYAKLNFPIFQPREKATLRC